MGKNMVSKRTKGKVDFKRKEDQVRRPVEDEKDKIEVCDERNNESDIEVIMKNCKVFFIYVVCIYFFILFSKISRDEAISTRQRFFRKNPDGLLSKEDFIEEATVTQRD